ncbi:MAG TPA: hypothetical protein PLR71_04990 [Deltaproteobacteria bacterium]|nr:hypothetical protein [Deltaproteobacteria bacterium]HQI80901.1 hypothetical protein [Deltaproteobacteria bacterium]
MKKAFILLATLAGTLVLSCGGGGGGGGGGGDDGGNQAIDASAYFMRDTTRDYTFTETIVASSGNQSVEDKLVKLFTYDMVTEIPSKYGGTFGGYPGPYRLETVFKDGEVAVYTYTDPDGNVVVSDDTHSFTRISDNTYTGTIPTSVVLGQTYSTTSREKLYNSDIPDGGFWGQELGTSVTASSMKPVAEEVVTVPAGRFSALKVEIRYTVTYTPVGGTATSNTFSGYQWFSEDMGLVKAVIEYSITENSVTVDFTITDELSEVSG